MRRERLQPADQIIRALGGASVVAEKAKVAVVTVNRWRWRTDEGGTGGYIPRRHHDKLLEAAKEIGIELPVTAFADPTIATAYLDAVAA